MNSSQTMAPFCYTEVVAGKTNIGCFSVPATTTLIGAMAGTSLSSNPSSSPTAMPASPSASPASAASTPASQPTPSASGPVPPASESIQPSVVSPTPEETNQPSTSQSGRTIIRDALSVQALIGISAGVVAAVAIIGVLACLLLRKSRKRAKVETAEYNDATPPQYEAMAEHQEYDSGKSGSRYAAASLATHGPAELDTTHEPIELDSRSLSPAELPS